MKRLGAEVVGSLVWLAVGVFFAVGAVMLQPGTPRNPGPGFLPLIMSLLLVLFSVGIVLKEVAAPAQRLRRIEWMRQLLLIAAVFAYGALLDFLGFLLSTFALMLGLFGMLFTGEHPWLRSLACAAATAVIGWLVFAVALKVPFPRGFW